MLSSVNSIVLDGLGARRVRIEVDVHRGLPGFAIVGMREASVSRVHERVRAAVINSGYEFPLRRVVVNVAPASVRRTGAGLDLALAAALLHASGQLDWPGIEKVAFLGGLGLDARVRPIDRTQAILDAAWKTGVRTLVTPAGGDPWRPPAEPVEILPVETLGALASLAALAKGRRAAPAACPEPDRSSGSLSDVPDTVRIGEILIDLTRRRVTVGGRDVHLAGKEFALLRVLAAEPRRVFGKEELLRDVWGLRLPGRTTPIYPPGRTTRTVETGVSRLRRKLDPESQKYVADCGGIGYRLLRD